MRNYPENEKEALDNKQLTNLSQEGDIIIPEKQHLNQFLSRYTPQDTIWVFDFDGTLIHKGYNSFSPINNSKKDTKGELLKMKIYMDCIKFSDSYEELWHNLTQERTKLPQKTQLLAEKQSFAQFKAEQLNYFWQFTMEKVITWKLPLKEFDLDKLAFRPGATQLIDTLLDQGDQVLIITAGVGNVVRYAMENQGYDLEHPYLHIKGNDFILDNKGRAAGFDPDLITPYTKMHVDYHKYGIGDKSFAIQAGDSIGDTQMITDHFVKEDIINIGFANGDNNKINTFTRLFDTVHTDEDSSFEPIQKTFL